MKLLHVTATHLKPTGGIPVVLSELVSHQNALTGFEARVLSIKSPVKDINSAYFDFLGDRLFADYIKFFSPDIVIFHSFYFWEYIKLYKILKKNNIPYFIQPHGSFMIESMKKSKIKKTVARAFFFNKFVRNSDGIVYLNQSEQKSSLYKCETNLIIPNGITIEDSLRKKGNKYKSSSSVEFYYLGRFDINHKGLDILIDALEMLDNSSEGRMITFSFYGVGSHSQVKYIENRIHRLRNINVFNRGPLLGKEKVEHLCGKIMVLTSRYEGFPMTVLEALSYGNPCIVTKETNVLDEVVLNNLGWACSLDAQSIASAMLKAYDDYLTSQEEYFANCVNYVSSEYSWKRIAQISYEELKKFERG
ncbi:glycosyltransferase [Streptococcus suis]|uniref:glycosyltransferase n=1 Tax=Streptococcus suis TaxID=1307 RepID=UPI0038B9D0A5